MKLVPEKAEGKIFLLILVISTGMSLLMANLMVMTQAKTMRDENRNSLAQITDRCASEIRDGLADRMDDALAANKVFEKALYEAHEKSGFNSAYAIESSTVERDISVFFEHSSSPSPQVQQHLDATLNAMQHAVPILQATFNNFYVAVENEFLCVSPAYASGLTHGPDQTGLREQYALAGPDENPGRGVLWGDIEYDRKRQSWFTTLVVPLYDGDDFLGVTGSDYSLEQIFNQLHELSGDTNISEAYIFDDVGNIIAHPYLQSMAQGNPQAPGWKIPSEDTAAPPATSIIKQYLSLNPAGDRALHIKLNQSGGDRLAYVAPIQMLDWKLAIIASNDHTEELLAALLWKLSLSAGVAAFILVFLLRACLRRLFIDRVVELEQATLAFAQHGLANFPEVGKDEIGRLVVAFKDMVDSLASREAELTVRNQQLKNEISGRLSAVESLRESERKFRTLFDKSSDAILVFDGEHLIDCNEAAVQMLECTSKEQLLKARPIDFAPEFQPDGTPSPVQSNAVFALAAKEGKHRYEWVARTALAREFWVDALITRVPYGGREVFYMVWRDITSRKEEDEERVRLTTAIEQAAEVIIVTDSTGTIQYVNPSFERLTGYSPGEALGKISDLLDTHGQDKELTSEIWNSLERGDVWKGRVKNTGKDGTKYQAETTISPVRDATGAINNFVIVSYDVTKEATLEAQLLQAHKMEAIGELASGIAHEINTPTQYIGDNIRFFQESFADIHALLDKYQELLQAVNEKRPAENMAKEIGVLIDEIELDYLQEEVPIAIEQSLEGNSRVAEIVRAMKEFAHPGIEEKTAVDINHAITNTIAVARNEWKYVAELVTEFDEELPVVPCLPGSFNQVILNIIVNAAHAIEDVVKDRVDEKGKITITTKSVGDWAEIRIADTGPGIPEKIRMKIFDPFFTTKDPGKGTGQGLALAHAVIVEKHGGTIEVESEPGEGTTFVVRIPLARIDQPQLQPETVGPKIGG